MPYTAAQLTTFYSNANLGIQPTAAESLLLSAYAQQDQSGSLTDAQTLAQVLQFSQDKTDVALSTYQFFTGATPSLAGLAFLVHGGSNPNDLSSAYYAGFNKENRYYNFAINLATGSSAATTFASTYGAVTFAQAVQAAYETIVGTSNVGAVQAAAAVAAITAQQSYFASIAAARAPGANQDIATKAVAIGYILEEAQKADVGAYAKGIDQFQASLATTGTATTGNLLTNYPAGNSTAGQTFVLTAGVDNLQGSAGNDTFNATVTPTSNPLGGLDVVNGGGGINTLNIADTATAAGASFAFPVGISVQNIQVENITTNGNVGTAQSQAGALDLSGVVGLTNVNIVAAGTVGESLNVADTTAASLTAGAVAVNVYGGNAVAVSGGVAVLLDGEALASATVVGSTGAVTIENDSVTGLADGKGTTLTTATLTSDTGNITVDGRGVNTLNLTGLVTAAQTVTVTNTTATGHALTVNANGVGKAAGMLTVTDANATGVTVNATGKDFVILSAAAAKSLTIGGAGALTLSAASTLTAVTAINASAMTGNLTLTDNYAKAVVTGGAGNDTVTLAANLTAASGGSINLGAGNNVLLAGGGSIGAGVTANGGTGGINTISAALVNAGNAGGISNFQVLDVSGFGSGAGNGALDTSLIGSVVSGVSILAATTNGVATLLNLGAAATVTDAVSGASSLVLSHAAGAGTLAVTFANPAAAATTLASLTSTGDTTLSVVSGGKAGATNAITALAETDNHLTSVTVTGSNAFTLGGVNTNTGAAAASATSAASSLTLIDASATTGGVNITAGASSTFNNVTTKYTGLTILGGSGGDTIVNHASTGVITEGATSALSVNTLTVDGFGATINDTSSLGADVINLNGVAGGETANLGGGTGVVVNTAAIAPGAGSFDTVQYGTGTATVVDSINYGVVATGVSASTAGNELVLSGTLHGNSLAFAVGLTNAAGAFGAAVNVGAAQTFDQAVHAADVAADVIGANTGVWFSYGGNTYILDNATMGGSADDLVVKLTGAVDLSHAAVTGGHLVFA